jgi:hypothetical protein
MGQSPTFERSWTRTRDLMVVSQVWLSAVQRGQSARGGRAIGITNRCSALWFVGSISRSLTFCRSQQSTVELRKSVFVVRSQTIWGTPCRDLLRQFRLTEQWCQPKLTTMDIEELRLNLSSDDPAIGLRASLALHRLAERVEAHHVASAREKGWSWQQIGDALGVTRQSVHTKYNKESS